MLYLVDRPLFTVVTRQSLETNVVLGARGPTGFAGSLTIYCQKHKKADMVLDYLSSLGKMLRLC